MGDEVQVSKRGGKREKLEITPITIRQTAMLKSVGRSAMEIAQELNISQSSVLRLLKRDDTKALIKSMETTAIQSAISVLKVELSRLLQKAVQVIERKLDEGDLDAVRVLFKGVGVESQEATKDSSQQITVIMPGAPQEPRMIQADIVQNPLEVRGEGDDI